MVPTLVRGLASTAAAAATALAGGALVTRTGNVPWARRWSRTNHAGEPVTLLEGPAYVAGGVLAASVSGLPGVVAVTGSGALGALDDLAGDGTSKGLRGHLGAAARGEVTTGAVKVVGLGVVGVAAAALADRRRGDVRAVDTLVAGAVVAGTANLANLLDLRPGRALKATLLGALPLLLSRRGGPTAGAAAGAALGVVAPDLAGRAMLGDTGANAAGALVGTALVEATGRRGRLTALALLTAATLASEKVSFTAVIESTPGLRALDAWGRSPR